MTMRIFLTGGTGLIGARLARRLAARGDSVVLLTRRPAAAGMLGIPCEVVEGDPVRAGPWQETAAGCDAIVNLAGENLFGRRWSAKFKAILHDSRVQATENCARALGKSPKNADGSAKVLVSASAIGYYGPQADELLDESVPPGHDFLARLCVDWEQATQAAVDAGVRVVQARIGVVLAKEGGALRKLLLPFKLGAGGPVASGRQYMSWIHANDVVDMFVFALDHAQASGPMNVTAPNPRPNREFAKALGRALGRPAFVWTPATMLRLLIGEAADIVATGQRVLPRRAFDWGYSFQFPELDAALAEILRL